MSIPLLATKLFIPPLKPGLVPRNHLVRKLDEGLAAGIKLILVSAPAGYGKTTLVIEWLANCKMRIAWLSLQEADNDPARFLTYLIAALQTIEKRIGGGLLSVLQSPQPLQLEVILTSLINEISSISEHFVLVLDDYHAIDSQQVDQSLAFLIEHQPPCMHLAISTREDPSLPLARMRVRNQLVELRATDLRFSSAEATQFLNRVMGLKLSGEDISALETRTEGWIAGLQMAAISMQGLPDANRFIESFTGSHRFVLDYLLEEVLKGQPEEVQTFLQCTSILERLCGPLCDAVLSKPTGFGDETLQSIDESNLFIIPLDHERCWYRYHHLFRDLLRKSLEKKLDPEGITKLHIHASEWYENNGLLLEAFRHATEANDVERAVRLMESKKMPLHIRGTATTILEWLRSLPISLLDNRPNLWWMQAAMLLVIGEPAGVEEMLLKAEAALKALSLPGSDLDESTRDLLGKIAAARANLAQTQAQADTILVQAHRSLEYLHPDNLSERSMAIRALGFACYIQGEYAEASRLYTEALNLAQKAGDTINTILASLRVGQIQESENQLYLAMKTYLNVLPLLDDYSTYNAPVAYLGLARIFYEWNDLNSAEQYGEKSLQLAQQYDQVIDRYILSELFLARLKLARKDVTGSMDKILKADQISKLKNYSYRIPDIAYNKARILLFQGNVNEVTRLVQQNDIPLMRARVLITQGNPIEAMTLVEIQRQQAEAKGLVGRLLLVKAVQSVVLFTQGEKDNAVQVLTEALAMAEPGGFIRLFLDEGAMMHQLLLEAASRGIMPDYVARLLAAFDAEKSKVKDKPDPHSHQPLIDPLSERELEILKLISEGLSNEEICKKLFLALDTVKGHNRRIFEKLQVHRRTEAIAKARDLNLI